MGITRKTWAAAAAGVLTLALAGCGSDDGDDFADQSYEEIKDTALEDMGEAESLRLSGTIEEDGQELTIDLAIGDDGGCAGSVAMDGAEGEIISNSDGVFIKGGEAFWEAAAPGQSEAILAMLGDKWAKTPVQEDEGFGEVCDLDTFVDELGKDDEDKMEVGDVEEVEGQDAVVLTGEAEDGGTTRAWVSVDSPHYILKMEKEGGDDPGHMLFTDYDEPVDTSSPPEDEYVDLTQGA